VLKERRPLIARRLVGIERITPETHHSRAWPTSAALLASRSGCNGELVDFCLKTLWSLAGGCLRLREGRRRS
jgi:hypothetical protein